MKTYYQRNRERQLATAKAYREVHRDYYRSKAEERRVTNPSYGDEWRDANREKVNEWARSPEQTEKRHLRNLKKRFGLTQEQFNKIFDAQDRKCAICKTGDFYGRWKAPAIDHCHTGGHVRGILCQYCNRMIGFGRHSAQIMKNAADYLSKESLFNYG